ncbi:hypothetical protein [Pseudoalteromonas xiamenensis]|uniref:hypothetical protein n=1 Tax=Pseudoalteromonas xiamenensis TaxID=882626 RepID=UPI001FCA52FD|nr:hypothetical protein [Pseudoalteromonas xiamenensis]WMN61049.1 hypothetical protein NI389_06560 [Pseudoalteromonas xiamenensis]
MVWVKIKPVTRLLQWVVLVALWLPAIPYVYATESVEMFIRDDVYEDYLRFLNGRSPLDVDNFKGHYIRRDVVDMIIVQQALMLGGYKKTFQYRPGKVNFRNTRLLEQGKLLLSFDSYWLADAKALADKLFISAPVIRKGEYFAGIYANPTNEKVKTLSRIEDFEKLTAVSTPRWRTDWQTLTGLPLKELFIEHEWLAQAQMVHRQWADFMMMPLMPSLDNAYQLEDIRLVAHPKFILELDGSRHFVVSKNHPEGERAYQAIEKGLSVLRAQGRIKKAYEQAGFIPDLTRYTVINPHSK